jgi:hypothetical protein
VTIAEHTRLAELRAKTDEELTVLMDRRLRRALSNLLSGDCQRSAARRVYAEARAVIPVIYRLSPARRKQLEALLARLCILLATDQTTETPRVCAAC